MSYPMTRSAAFVFALALGLLFAFHARASNHCGTDPVADLDLNPGDTFRFCIEDRPADDEPTLKSCLVLQGSDPTIPANQVVCVDIANGEISAELAVPTPMLCELNDAWNAYSYGPTQISVPAPQVLNVSGVACGAPDPPIVR
jgi:hypothetical protein